MKTRAPIFLGLGSNLGNRIELLQQAVENLSIYVDDVQISSVYESAPYQGMDQPSYYNQVLFGYTGLSSYELHEVCLNIEEQLGRERTTKWASRLIDIDLLYYDQLILQTPNLTIPHADLQNRGFVLLPMMELNSFWQDPRFHCSIQQLWSQWNDVSSEEVPKVVPTK